MLRQAQQRTMLCLKKYITGLKTAGTHCSSSTADYCSTALMIASVRPRSCILRVLEQVLVRQKPTKELIEEPNLLEF